MNNSSYSYFILFGTQTVKMTTELWVTTVFWERVEKSETFGKQNQN